MKITTQLLATINALLVVAFGGVASVYLNKIDNSRVVNYTGIVRGASQRLVKLEMAEQESDELILRLDAIVNGLINSDAELNLPAATDPAFLLKMQEVEAAWEKLKVTIERVRQDPNFEDALVAESENYFELTNEAVFAAENFSKATAQRVRIIQLLILGVNLAIIVLIWYVTRRITSTLQESTTSIASSSTEIASTMAQQERSISEQARAVSETTTSMEELGASTRQSSEQAAASTAGARQALELAEEGNKAVEQTLEGITTLKEKVGSIAEQIMYLSEQSGQISLVSELVGDIAIQTNMLALNASVEAARAGESGKGFNVVAGEIRKLADQSKKSAEKINDLVRDIQTSLSSTVVVTDEGIKKADLGIELVQQTAETFASVSDAINHIFFNTQQISMTAKQQALAVQQVVAAINQLNVAAQETAAGINQVKLSTQQLNGAAKSLKAAV